jgi:hypothetical protein
MLENNEYEKVLEILYNKSLILENFSDFHPHLSFWFFDALAHLDYTISLFAYNADSPRNILSRELLKYRSDIIKNEPYAGYADFMNWLRKEHKQEYEKFPLFLQKIHNPDEKASYRSFHIVLDPDDKQPIPASVFRVMIDEMFDKAYLASLYNGSSTASLYSQYIDSR